MQLVEMLVSKLFDCILSNFYCICVRRSVGVAEVAAQHFIAAALEEISSLTAAGDNDYVMLTFGNLRNCFFQSVGTICACQTFIRGEHQITNFFNITMLKQRVFFGT